MSTRKGFISVFEHVVLKSLFNGKKRVIDLNTYTALARLLAVLQRYKRPFAFTKVININSTELAIKNYIFIIIWKPIKILNYNFKYNSFYYYFDPLNYSDLFKTNIFFGYLKKTQLPRGLPFQTVCGSFKGAHGSPFKNHSLRRILCNLWSRLFFPTVFHLVCHMLFYYAALLWYAK